MKIVTNKILEPENPDNKQITYSNYDDFKLLLENLKTKSTRDCQKKLIPIWYHFKKIYK